MDEVTQQTRDMYSQYPYPKRDHTYIENLLRSSKKNSKFFFNYSRALELVTGNKKKHQIQVLNAGCGTGENFIFQAIMEPETNFLLLDVTPRSIEKVRSYVDYFKLNNVEVLEGDIMELDMYLGDSYNRHFDFIISTGVLHHLSSPETGLINLKKRLKLDGIMCLMLYGKHGRYEINLMQDLVNTFQPDRSMFDERIEIMQDIVTYLRSNTHLRRLKTSPSMEDYLSVQNYKLEELVDAFLHINENVYTVKDIFDFLATADMKFLFFKDEPVWLNTPGLSDQLLKRITSLPALERYSALEDLDGYKKMHTFFCADANCIHTPPQFDEIMNCKIYTWPESSLIYADNPEGNAGAQWRFISSDAMETEYRSYQVPLSAITAEIALLCRDSISFQPLSRKIKKKHKMSNSDILDALKYLFEHKAIYLVRN